MTLRFPQLSIKDQVNFKLKDLRYTVWTMEQLLKDVDELYVHKQELLNALDNLWNYGPVSSEQRGQNAAIVMLKMELGMS